MPERIIFPEWRKQNEPTKYPFAENATLTNVAGRVIVEGTFLDGALFPIGGGAGLFLSKVEIDHQNVTMTIGSPNARALAAGTIALVNPEDNVVFTDTNNRPAGILVSEGPRLGIFQSWGVGVHEFKPTQTEFAATVCFPTPEVGVRGIVLEDGTVFTGDVWLVGDDGVVLRTESLTLPATCKGPAETIKVVRIDVIGDPLFRRRLCLPTDLFTTPKLIRTLRIVGPNQTFECAPDAYGDIRISSNNSLAADTVLRLVTTPSGLKIGAVGSVTDAQT